MEDGAVVEKKVPDEILRVKVVRKERTVILENEDGSDRPLTVREMLGTVKGRWQTGMAKRARIDAKGNFLGIQDYTGLECSLLCLCLYDNATGKLVPETEIAQWPTTVQQAIFTVCQEVNGLTQASENAEKKTEGG